MRYIAENAVLLSNLTDETLTGHQGNLRILWGKTASSVQPQDGEQEYTIYQAMEGIAMQVYENREKYYSGNISGGKRTNFPDLHEVSRNLYIMISRNLY